MTTHSGRGGWRHPWAGWAVAAVVAGSTAGAAGCGGDSPRPTTGTGASAASLTTPAASTTSTPAATSTHAGAAHPGGRAGGSRHGAATAGAVGAPGASMTGTRGSRRHAPAGAGAAPSSSPRPGAPRPGRGPSHAASASPRPATITITLHGGGSATITACGASHHYRTYRPGTTITVSGLVAPPPATHWKVKLRIKRCAGGSFTEVGKLSTQRNRHTGTFSASFPAPASGDYSIRAALYLNGSVVRQSPKRHFATA